MKEKFLLQLNCSHDNLRTQNFFSGRVIGIFGFNFYVKTKKMQRFIVHKVPTIDEIDELVGLNILPANFIENLLPPRDKLQHENSDE